MAEAIGRKLAVERGLDDLTVSSAGTSAWDGAPASDGALLVSMERGVDLNGHRATVLSREVVERADLILVMGSHHLERVQVLGGEGKSYLLTAYASRDAATESVADPFGGDLEAYRATFRELEEHVARAFDRLVADRKSGGAA